MLLQPDEQRREGRGRAARAPHGRQARRSPTDSRQAERVIRTEQRRDPTRRALAIVVTDGRAHDREAATRAIRALAKVAAGIVVLDGEQGPVRLHLAQRLADAAGAHLLPLEAAA